MMYGTGMLLNIFFFPQLSCDTDVSESGCSSDCEPGPIMLGNHKVLSLYLQQKEFWKNKHYLTAKHKQLLQSIIIIALFKQVHPK